MKYMSIVIGILMSISGINAMLVTLPSEQILTNRLRENGFGYLVEKTKIIDQLAQQRKSVEDIAAIAYQASRDDNKKIIDSLLEDKVPMMENLLCWRTKELIEIIVRNNEESSKEVYE